MVLQNGLNKKRHGESWAQSNREPEYEVFPNKVDKSKGFNVKPRINRI